MKDYVLKSVLWKEGRSYVARCLNVEVSSFGKTKKEALGNLQEALELFFEGSEPIDIVDVEAPEVVETRFRGA